jgi:3-isopropylmalate/(R)-2-methylmalate dehydratase small subunit
VKAFKQLTGFVAPLDRANVDTDQIIPKQYLKSIHRTGFGDNLFDAWRYLDEGDIGVTPNERRIDHGFVLNQPAYQGASVLLARRNFGCGSSREHAVWALLEYGFRCVIAPSFADIFLSNCFKNGLLPIVLEEEVIDRLFDLMARDQVLEVAVDLPAQTVTLAGGEALEFAIDANRKRALVEGLDDIGMTLGHAQTIREFEQSHARRMPWLFSEID